MSYTRNFGFRSTANIFRNARFRTPATGSPMVIGTAVTVDSTKPGRMRQAGAAEVVTPGCGILVYEHIQMQGVDPQLTSPQDFDTVPTGKFAQMVHGVGVKVWLRNTADKPLYDGRTQAGRTLVAGLGATPTLVVGDFLCPAADGTWVKAGTTDPKWLYIESINATTGVVEASLTF